MAGLVLVDGKVEDKPGMKYNCDAKFALKEQPCRYVSRGGLKLEKAIDVFGLDLGGLVCVDMGASTGGFTDCMLLNGASRVYSIDVGYGQLAYKLRNDPRVVNLEKTNIRKMDTSLIEESIDFLSMDVSFISLKHMFPVARRICREGAKIVSLIKPQFEAEREQVEKGGIVRDPEVHAEVIKKVIGYAEENGFTPLDISFSPIKGTKGNIEYLLLSKVGTETGSEGGTETESGAADACGEGPAVDPGRIEETIALAFGELQKNDL